MKLALPTLLLTSMASLPYAAARVGQTTKAGEKILKLKSQQPLDPRKVHLAPKDASEVNRIVNGEDAETADEGEFPFYVKWLESGNLFCGVVSHPRRHCPHCRSLRSEHWKPSRYRGRLLWVR
jgi:hypothetical protein